MTDKIGQGKQITYKIHKAVFLLDKISDQILKNSIGFGFSQFLVMRVLAGQPGVPQKFVAAALDQTQAAVSRQIDLLVAGGLVARQNNPQAKREYILSLTKLGKKKFKLGRSLIDNTFASLYGDWSKAEKACIIKALDKLILGIHAKVMKQITGLVLRRDNTGG